MLFDECHEKHIVCVPCKAMYMYMYVKNQRNTNGYAVLL